MRLDLQDLGAVEGGNEVWEVQMLGEGKAGRVGFHRVHEGVWLRGVHNSLVLTKLLSSCFVHCTTQTGTTPVHRGGRELSTPKLFTVWGKAAPCSLWPQVSYHMPATFSSLFSTC